MEESPEIQNSIIQAAKDRLNSPFSGSFLLFFLGWNWKIPYYLITQTNMGAHDKIEFAIKTYWNTPQNIYPFYFNFFCPLGLTIVYLMWNESVSSMLGYFSKKLSYFFRSKSLRIDLSDSEANLRFIKTTLEALQKQKRNEDQNFQDISRQNATLEAKQIELTNEIAKLVDRKNNTNSEVESLLTTLSKYQSEEFNLKQASEHREMLRNGDVTFIKNFPYEIQKRIFQNMKQEIDPTNPPKLSGQ